MSQLHKQITIKWKTTEKQGPHQFQAIHESEKFSTGYSVRFFPSNECDNN